MNFNKTTAYALRILSFMAKDETKLYSVNEIFENNQIPFRYLRKLMTSLTKGELIISIQGKFGGYKIAKKLEDIKLLHIIQSVEPDFLSNICFFGLHECAFHEPCIMHNEWTEVNNQIRNVLEKTNLSSIKIAGVENISISNNSLNT